MDPALFAKIFYHDKKGLQVPNKFCFPPLAQCLGTSPNQAESSLPFLNPFGVPMPEIIAVEVIGPIPSISDIFWHCSLLLNKVTILASQESIRLSITTKSSYDCSHSTGGLPQNPFYWVTSWIALLCPRATMGR